MIRFRSVCARLASTAIAPASVCAAATLGLLSLAPQAHAQAPGTLDVAFNPFVPKVTVYAVAVDSQQRIVIGGDNRTFSRITPDGSGDSNFSFSDFGGSARIVFGVAIDRTDRVYAVGGFDKKGTNDNSVNITRFFSDGSRINRGFDAGTGSNDTIVTVLLQPTDANVDDDLVLVGGLFSKFRGEERNHLARLHAAGTIDESFDPNLNFDDNVYALALQNDPATGTSNGQIVVAGAFETVNGEDHAKLARINFDGSLDHSFAPDVNGDIFAVQVQADGKVVIGGQFDVVNGNSAKGLARLNQDGSYDATFNAGVSDNENQSSPPTAVYAIRLQADGKAVVAGNFLKINGATRRFLGRLNIDGSVDAGFDPGDAILNRAEAISIQADNRIVVGEVVSKRVGSATTYPNVVKRVYGDPVPPPPAPLPVVTVAGGKNAVEGGKSGSFVVSRAQADLSQPLTVYYHAAKKGNAVRPKAGIDYETFPGFVVIPAGQTSATISVIPLGSVLEKPQEQLTIRLHKSATYETLGEGEASIRIKDAPAS